MVKKILVAVDESNEEKKATKFVANLMEEIGEVPGNFCVIHAKVL